MSVRLGDDPRLWLAAGLGAGLAPRAPGTAGTLVAIPLWWLLSGLPLAAYAAVVVVLFALGVPLCTRAGRAFGAADHPAIVWDEIVGFLVTLFALPASWLAAVAGFLLFRAFDIAKPFPVAAAERLPRGLGVMADDLLAGAYACAVLHLVQLWIR